MRLTPIAPERVDHVKTSYRKDTVNWLDPGWSLFKPAYRSLTVMVSQMSIRRALKKLILSLVKGAGDVDRFSSPGQKEASLEIC
jgi:hypothetical protein